MTETDPMLIGPSASPSSARPFELQPRVRKTHDQRRDGRKEDRKRIEKSRTMFNELL